MNLLRILPYTVPKEGIFTKLVFSGWGRSSVVECLHSTCEALGLILSTKTHKLHPSLC